MRAAHRDITHHMVPTNSITLHVARSGPADGLLVILLHGFPEYWRGWIRQIPALAAAGMWVWVPDQRGYNLSARPRGVSAYGIAHLAADILGLIDASGRERAAVVGHDWGAAVAWWLGIHHPERLEKLAILNVPHPKVMARHLRQSQRQRLKSLYMAFFQLPGIPELLARQGNWRAPARAMTGTARPGTFSDDDMHGYRQAWSQPLAFTAMLNWYRAIPHHMPRLQGPAQVSVPTLMIWGARDAFLDVAMARPSIARCTRGRLELFEDASHWVQHEEPTRVNRLLIDFLGQDTA